MQETPQLKRMLENMAKTYHEEEIAVKFHSTPHASIDGDYVAVTPDVNGWLSLDPQIQGAEELRVAIDSLSHECEHIRKSDLGGKKRISERYRNEYNSPLAGKIAGDIQNILEDQYIDFTRTERFRGLRRTLAFKTSLKMRDAKDISELDAPNAMMAGLFQIAFAGYANGIKDADDDVRAFLGWAATHIERARYEHDPQIREALGVRITERLFEVADIEKIDPDEFETFRMGNPDVEEADDVEVFTSPEPDADDAESIAIELGLPEPDDADADEDGDAGDGDDADEERGDDGEDGSGSGEEDDADEESEDGGADGSGDEDAEGDDSESSPGESDGSDGDEDAGEGDDSDSEPEGDSGREEIENMLEQMDERDDAGDGGKERFGVDEGDLGTSEFEQRKFDRLQNEIEKAQDPVVQRQAKRDERIEAFKEADEENDFEVIEAWSDEVRDYLNETGLADRVRRAFSRLASQDEEFAAEEGDNIHVRNAIRHISGDYSETELYTDEHVAAHGGRLVGVALDCSGSMQEDMKKAKAALGALYLATHEIGDAFTANAFYTRSNYSAGTGPEDPITDLITGPSESFEWGHLDSVTCQNYTPTADGMMDIGPLMAKTPARDRVLFVICDGRANIKLGGGKSGMQASVDAREAARKLRREMGVKVIGIGIGEIHKSRMAKMFGEDGYVMADSKTLADDLVRLYQRELNVNPVE